MENLDVLEPQPQESAATDDTTLSQPWWRTVLGPQDEEPVQEIDTSTERVQAPEVNTGEPMGPNLETPVEARHRAMTASAGVGFAAAQTAREEPTPGILETAGAFFQREAVIGSLATFGLRVNNDLEVEAAPNFNPYTHAQSEVAAGHTTLEEVHELLGDDLDNVVNPLMFRELLVRRRRERGLEQTIERGPWQGVVLGMGLTGFDPGTWFPAMRLAQSASRLKRAGQAALGGAGFTTGQEVVLHASQDRRTIQESYLAVGAASLLTGVGGAILHPKSPLQDANPKNPITHADAREADGVAVGVPGEDTAASEVVPPMRSVGAAGATLEDAHLTQLAEADPLKKAMGWSREKMQSLAGVKGATPVSRALTWTSAKARQVTQQIVDLGGALRRGMNEGQAQKASVEDIKRDLEEGHKNEVVALLDNRKELNHELAKLGAKVPVGHAAREFSLRPLSQDQFHQIVYKKLTDLDHQNTGQGSGEITAMVADVARALGLDPTVAAPVIDKYTDRVVAEMHKANKVLEERAIAAKLPGFTKPLGQNYGLPQKWRREWIIHNREEAVRLFTEIASGRPDADWLRANFTHEVLDEAGAPKIDPATGKPQVREMTLEDFDALPAASTRRANILDDWAGDEYQRQLARADAAYTAAQRQFKDASLQLDLVLNAVRPAKEAHKHASFAALKARARAGLARLLEEGHANKAAVLREALEDAELARKAAWAERVKVRGAKKLAMSTLKAAAKDMKEAEKAIQKLQNPREWAEKLVDSISDTNRFPNGILESDIVEVSGRLKERRIHLRPADRRRAEELGALDTDLVSLRKGLYTDLGGRIAMMESFGSVGLEKELKEIADSYDEMINSIQAAAKEDPKRYAGKLASLQEEKLAALEDVQGLVKRAIGQPLTQLDPDSFVTWAAGRMRQWNFIMNGPGFILSALPDLSAVLLQHGPTRALFPALRETFAALRGSGIAKDSPELLRFVESLEIASHYVGHARQADADPIGYRKGIGAPGSRKHRGTSMVDAGMDWIGEKVAQWNPLYGWTRRLKMASGLTQLSQLAEMLPKYAKLSRLDKAKLASLGVDEKLAAELAEKFAEHGHVRASGQCDPQAHLWAATDKKRGLELERELRMIVRRVQDRAVPTPGLGDTPLLMSKPMGALWLQFASFGFKYTNTFLRPSLQRLLIHKDHEVITAYLSALILGTFSTAIRGYIAGRDMEEYTAEKWIYESMSRSGFFGYLSPYVDSGLKLAGFDSNRYAQQAWWQGLLGPSASLVTKTGSAVAAGASGDAEKMRDKALQLAPARIIVQLLQRLNEMSEE